MATVGLLVVIFSTGRAADGERDPVTSTGPFLLMQLIRGALGFALIRALYPESGAVADVVVAAHP